jgi:hypothetical protein
MMTDIKSGTFFLFGSSVVFGLFFALFFVPETKGFSLEEMDILFSRKGFAMTWRKQAEQCILENRESGVTSATVLADKNKEIQVEKV